MRAWIHEHPQFNGREGGPLQGFFTSVTEIGGIVLNKSDSSKLS